MSTYLTIWHYLIILLGIILIILGVFLAFRQQEKKIIAPMIFSISLIVVLVVGFTLVAIDKYTKKVHLSNVHNHRILSIEKIVYTGIVKNVGNHTIGKVTFEVKLVNKAHAGGKVKAGSFYSPSGFAEFFSGGMNILYKPQTVTKKFVVAKDLKPNKAKSFRVMFDYPPYFENVSQFTSVTAH
ncbi:DUF2393 family protein [Sulfurimonas sp. HSL-1716]|uniref:DUF2393 family protein n=1 Tax=Hydrocurvibacter sulfurireducens TaxID=3131937 RepID=UPI0031F90EE5